MQKFGAQTWEPNSLGLTPGPASHCCVVLARCLATPCLSFPMYKMGMMRIIEPPNGITSPHD